MSTIMPQSELTRKAVAWIGEQCAADATLSLTRVIEKAAMQFNLGPKDVEFLTRFFTEQGEK